MIFQLLTAFVCTKAITHGYRPDTTRNTTHNRVFRIHTVTEKERQVGSKIIDLHATCQIAFHIGKTVGERQGKLRYRVGTGFGDVISGDRH